MTSRSGPISRGGGYPASSRGRQERPAACIACNRCRKPLSTTLFICACNCVFCEDCTYNHFNSNSNCPACGKVLGPDDFMELVVADPSAATKESTKNTFQTMFTKFSTDSKSLSYQEMCTRFVRSMDDCHRAARFLMKQFVADSNKQGQRSGDMGRAYEKIKEENTQLKQAANTKDIRYQQMEANYQNRVQALSSSVQECQKKLEEKDDQIAQLRELIAADGMARVPSSSHSHSSGGKRGPSVHQRPPMESIVQARGRRSTLGPMAGIRPLSARPASASDSVITPIQPPSSRLHRPRSSGSYEAPGTPRIRDLSNSAGYVFSRSNTNHVQAGKRRRMGDPVSPSTAFAYSSSQRQQNQAYQRGFRR